jgi:uncharacterized protein YjbI with pentapeptide repeats
MKNYRNLVLIAIAFIAGGFATLATGLALAHGGDTNLIHGCVRNNGLLSGFVRIVGANTNCNNNETALDWNIQGVQGPPGSGGSSDIICVGCTPRDLLFRLASQDFIDSDLNKSILSVSFFKNEDFTDSSFIQTVWTAGSGQGSNFTDTDFTEANLSSTSFGSDSVSNAANFTRANLTNVNFTDTGLKDVIMTDATITDVIWNHTTCPDGTNSDNNGNTCEGHLTP